MATKPKPKSLTDNVNDGLREGLILDFLTGGTLGRAKTAFDLSPIKSALDNFPAILKATPFNLVPQAAEALATSPVPVTPIQQFTKDAIKATPLYHVPGAMRRSESLRTALLGTQLTGDLSVLERGVKGFVTGDDTLEFGDIFRERGVPEPLAATIGLGQDVITDPLSWLLPAAIGGKGAAKAATKAVKPLEEVAVKTFTEKFPYDDVVAKTLAEGGTTTDLKGLAQKTGKIVSPYKNRERIINPDQFDKTTLNEYIKANQDLLKNPDHYVGTWKSPEGQIYLDVVIGKQSEQEAITIAQKANQKAIYDLDRGVEIPVEARAVVQPADEALRFQFNTDKTLADFDSQIADYENKIVGLTKEINETNVQPVKTALSHQLESLVSEKNKLVSDSLIVEAGGLSGTPIQKGGIRRALSLVGTYIKRQGSGGAALFNAFERSSSFADGLKAKWLTNLNSLARLDRLTVTREEMFNIAETLDGLGKPINGTVDNIVKVGRANFNEAAELAQRQGLVIRSKSGLTNPFKPRENYYPHLHIDTTEALENPTKLADVLEYSVRRGDFKSIDDATTIWDSYTDLTRSFTKADWKLPVNEKTKPFLQWLVDSRQAENIEQAEIKLRDFLSHYRNPINRNLERARELNVPFYDPDFRRVFPSYYSGVAERLGQTRFLGNNFEAVDAALQRIAEEGGDVEAVGKMANMALGRILPEQSLTSDAIRKLMNLEVASKLGQAVIMNASQTLNTATVTGLKNTALALRQSLTALGREEAFKSGAVFNEFTNALYGVGGDDITAKVADFVLTKTGFSTIESQNRIIAAISAKNWLTNDLVPALLKNDEQAYRLLKKFQLNPQKILQRGELTQDELQTFMRNVSSNTQYRARVLDAPEWVASPYGRLVNQFKSFIEQNWKFVREQVYEEAKAGNYKPLARYAVAAPVVGGSFRNLKLWLNGRDPRLETPHGKLENLADAAASVGAFGMFYDIYKSAIYRGESGIMQTLLGAGVSDTVNLANNSIQAFENREVGEYLNMRPLTKQLLGSVPILGLNLRRAVESPQTKKQRITKPLREALEKGQDISDILAAGEEQGFNADELLASAESGVKRRNKNLKEIKQSESSAEAFLRQLGFD